MLKKVQMKINLLMKLFNFNLQMKIFTYNLSRKIKIENEEQ